MYDMNLLFFFRFIDFSKILDQGSGFREFQDLFSRLTNTIISSNGGMYLLRLYFTLITIRCSGRNFPIIFQIIFVKSGKKSLDLFIRIFEIEIIFGTMQRLEIVIFFVSFLELSVSLRYLMLCFIVGLLRKCCWKIMYFSLLYPVAFRFVS
jgi:hypothetical protein